MSVKEDIIKRGKDMAQLQLDNLTQVYRTDEFDYLVRRSDGVGFYNVTIDPVTQAFDCNCNYMSKKGVCKHIECMIEIFARRIPILEVKDGNNL